MPISNGIKDREFDKFRESSSGGTSVATLSEQVSSDPNGQSTLNKKSGYIDSVSTNTPILNSQSYDTGLITIDDEYNYFGYEIFADQDLSGQAFWYDDEN